MRCPNCNYPVLPKFAECPKCHTPLGQGETKPATPNFDFDTQSPKATSSDFDFDAPVVKSEPQLTDGVSIISGKAVWSLAPGQIARRVTEREMADCGAVKGIVVQDGVTAAVFSDGVLIKALEGGIYRFSGEIIKEAGKRVIAKPDGSHKPVEEKPEQAPSQKKPGFFARLFGAKKVEAPKPAENKSGAPKPAENKSGAPKPAAKPVNPNAVRPQSVVTVYLISNRVFEEAFGENKQGGEYEPFEFNVAGHPVKIGVSMQMRVSDVDTFRKQYLIDTDSVTIDGLGKMMSPWVRQILNHTLSNIGADGNTLTPDQQSSLTDTLGALLQERLFGLSIINIFDLATTSEDFNKLQERERQLWKAEKDSELNQRENEFRNRLADLEMQQSLEHLGKENNFGLDRERENARYEQQLRELNRDNLLSEDEMKQFLAQHDMEMRLADAARNADEQSRRYESDKILNELESQKLIDRDEREALEERIATGKFERGQLNDIKRQQALAKATIEKLNLDTDLAMRQSASKHQLDINDLKQETERTGYEALLYGKRYELDRQKAVNELELKSINLDADIESRRKEDAYAEEKYRRDMQHNHDEWEEQFMRDGRELERKQQQRKADADFDFEERKRNSDLDFEQRKRSEEFDFDLTAKKAQFDFDLDDRRQDKDMERTIHLGTHHENLADRQHARDLEMRRQQQQELETKGNIAMRNMQAMMEAKRAAKKDELDATTDQLNIKSQMTAEQIAAEQLAKLDASAQSGFMDALKEKSSSAKEAEMARREAELTRQMHEQMMGKSDRLHDQNRNDLKEMMAQMMQMQQMNQQQAMDLARHSMDTSANIAASHAAANATAAERRVADLERDNERYRQDTRHAQERVDANQTQSLDYTTRVTVNDSDNGVAPSPAAKAATHTQQAAPQSQPEMPRTIPLNTAWLRDHGFEGSFNELAGALSSLGGEISKDYDEEGNPVIVVDGLPEGQVFDILERFQVRF